MKLGVLMGVLTLSLVLWVGLAVQMTASAQEAEETKPAATVTREVAEEDDDEAEDEGNFLPTEKINVDSSVSFPVDI